MSQVDLEALGLLFEKWQAWRGSGAPWPIEPPPEHRNPRDKLFIAAVNALPALLEEVRAGRELDRLREAALAYGAAAKDENSTPSARHWLREQLCDAARAALASPSVPTQEVAAHDFESNDGVISDRCIYWHRDERPPRQCGLPFARHAGPPPAPPVLGAAPLMCGCSNPCCTHESHAPEKAALKEGDTDFTQSLDAREWAAAFMRFNAKHDIAADEGTMLSWFANAIMRGWDGHAHRYPPPSGDPRGAPPAPPAAPAPGDADRMVVAELEVTCQHDPGTDYHPVICTNCVASGLARVRSEEREWWTTTRWTLSRDEYVKAIRARASDATSAGGGGPVTMSDAEGRKA
jgi:hypothetical protein